MTAAVATLAALLVASIAAVAVLVVTRPKNKLTALKFGLMKLSGPGAPPGGTTVLVSPAGHPTTKGLEPKVPAGTKLVGEVFIAGIGPKGSVEFLDKAMYTGKPSGTPTTVFLYSTRGGYLIYVPSAGWIQPSNGTNIVADPAKAEVFQLAPIAQ